MKNIYRYNSKLFFFSSDLSMCPVILRIFQISAKLKLLEVDTVVGSFTINSNDNAFSSWSVILRFLTLTFNQNTQERIAFIIVIQLPLCLV